MKRHNGRIIAALALYNIDINNIEIEDAVKITNEIIEEVKLEVNLELNETVIKSLELDDDYAISLVLGTVSHLKEIDDLISKSIINYTIDRLSYLDRAICRVATYEMKFTSTPKVVCIDEAIEITREYSDINDESQIKFNNRLLDNISKLVYEQ